MDPRPRLGLRTVSDTLRDISRRAAANISNAAQKRKRILYTVVIALHVLLWSSVCAAVVAVFVLISAPKLDTVLPTVVLMFAAVSLES